MQTITMVLNSSARTYIYVLLCCLAMVWRAAHAEDAQARKLTSGEEGFEQALESRFKAGLIEGAIRFNPHFRHAKVMVQVDNNVVTLVGYVSCDASRQLAEQLSLSVKGIEQVDNKLRVAPAKLKSFQTATQGDSAQNRLSNVTITNKVKSQLLANRSTSGINIEVETNNRVVTITGEVDSDTERELAYWVVKNTQGVKTVVDRLDVMSNEIRQAAIQVNGPTVETVE